MRILLPLLLCFCYAGSNAQSESPQENSTKKMAFSISAGVALPVGKFSFVEIDPSNRTVNLPGAATTGMNGKADFRYFLTDRLGLYFMICTTSNKAASVDSTDLFYDPNAHSHGLGGGYVRQSYSYSTRSWNTTGVLAGVAIEIKKQKPAIHIRMGGGLQRVQSPESIVTETGYLWQIDWQNVHPYNSTIIMPGMTSDHAVFGAGIDFNFPLKNKFGWLLSLDYLTSRSSFTGQSTSQSEVYDGVEHIHSESLQTWKLRKSVSLLQVNVGVTYRVLPN